MIDVKMSFAQVEPAKRRLAPLLGLGMAAVLSAGLWAVLVVAVAQLV
jgi:hypothetical protein